MAELRDLLTELGLADPRTLLQSGNLVFRSDSRTTAQIEQLLEREASMRLALQTQFFLRTAEEWSRVVARNPFRKEAEHDPGHLVVMYLKDAPGISDVRALQAAVKG